MRVMPNVLQELMQNENISTTMAFYVGRNAEATAEAAWSAAAQHSAKPAFADASDSAKEKPQPIEE